jgi:hypothetical protein
MCNSLYNPMHPSILSRMFKRVFYFFTFLFFAFTVHATNYYFSNSGSDANIGTNSSSPFAQVRGIRNLFLALRRASILLNFLHNSFDIHIRSACQSKSIDISERHLSVILPSAILYIVEVRIVFLLFYNIHISRSI